MEKVRNFLSTVVLMSLGFYFIMELNSLIM